MMLLPIWDQQIPLWDSSIPQPVPTLTPFLLRGNDRPCVLVFPGGGYAKKAWDHEGIVVAEWLNTIGVSAFVLDYRITPYEMEAILCDAQRSIRFVRQSACAFGICPDRIGVCGFSAGGHLAACCATLFSRTASVSLDPVEQCSDRPDFAILAYGVLTFEEPFANTGTRRHALGDRAKDPALARRYSPIHNVTEECPAMYLWTTRTDQAVSYENTTAMYRACQEKKVKSRVKLFDRGPHGLGIPRAAFPDVAAWTDDCALWLREQNII